MPELKPKERLAIINSLRGGVVPNTGLHHIMVGRTPEIKEVMKDVESVKAGATTIRFIVGEFGSGKSFFLNFSRALAHTNGFVVLSADITTEKVFCSSDGKARALFSELVKNMSTKTRPEGNALKSVIEKWISSFGDLPVEEAAKAISRALESLQNFVSGFDFAKVIGLYYTAYKGGDDAKMANCLRWLRAEYETKTDAKKELGVSTIIDDDFYDYLKLYGAFCRLAGFSGMLVNIDELAALTRLRAPTRNKNYETLLTIFNDCLQGAASGFMFYVGGTPEFIEDKYRGLHSYGAFATRLAPNPFETTEARDLSGPQIRLANLSREELAAVFVKIRDVFASYDPSKYLLDDTAIETFLAWIIKRLGAHAYLTPRESIKTFVNLMSQLENNPTKRWQDFLPQQITVATDPNKLSSSGSEEEPTGPAEAAEHGQGNVEQSGEMQKLVKLKL